MENYLTMILIISLPKHHGYASNPLESLIKRSPEIADFRTFVEKRLANFRGWDKEKAGVVARNFKVIYETYEEAIEAINRNNAVKSVFMMADLTYEHVLLEYSPEAKEVSHQIMLRAGDENEYVGGLDEVPYVYDEKIDIKRLSLWPEFNFFLKEIEIQTRRYELKNNQIGYDLSIYKAFVEYFNSIEGFNLNDMPIDNEKHLAQVLNNYLLFELNGKKMGEISKVAQTLIKKVNCESLAKELIDKLRSTDFECSCTGQLPEFPVWIKSESLTPEKNTFELDLLLKWLKEHSNNPMTRDYADEKNIFLGLNPFKVSDTLNTFFNEVLNKIRKPSLLSEIGSFLNKAKSNVFGFFTHKVQTGNVQTGNVQTGNEEEIAENNYSSQNVHKKP